MAGLTASTGAGRGDVDLLFGQKSQHGLALDAHLAEVQHLGHGVLRAVDDYLREGLQPLPQLPVQRTHGSVPALHGLCKAGGRCGQPHGVGQVFGAGAHLPLLLAAQIGRLESLHQPVGKVERANALGRMDLVAAHRERINVVQFDGHTHPCLHRVHMDDGTAVAVLYLGGKAFHIVAGADLIVHHHAGHKDGVLVHPLQHGVNVQRAVCPGSYHGNVVALLCQTLQRPLYTGVLEAGHYNALAEGAGLHRAQQRQIIALAAAGGKVQFPAFAAQRARYGGAGGVQSFFTARARAVQAGRVCPVLPHGLVDDVRHLGRYDGGGRVVQIM